MKILKLKLRGAVGIRKGLGLEEIEIDFTQFNPGLVALTGRNGSGKTTIMENLHPYRMMVSREGSLQNHFYLKDSYRILEFEYNGDHYASKILIDALTGGSEAYLFKNGKPLNEGKLTTYDEAIESLLGSPELFFNSVFSGQKSKGIAELKPADRRKLFYELLNLNIYEHYLERAKAELKSNELKLSQIEGEIKSLNDNQANVEELEKERLELLEEQIKITGHIAEIENKYELINNQLNEVVIKIKLANEKLERNEEINKNINELSEQIESITAQHNNKIARLNSEIADNEKLLTRYKKLSDPESKKKIEDKLKEIQELNNNIEELKDEYSNIQKYYSEFQKVKANQLKELKEKTSILDQLKHSKFSLAKDLEAIAKLIQQHQNSIEIIDKVPCDEATGSKCQFLLTAYKNKEELPELLEKEKQIMQQLNDKSAEVAEADKELEKIKLVIADAEKTDNEFDSKLSFLNAKIVAIKDELKNLEKDNWAKLYEEMKDAEHNAEIVQSKILSTKQLIEESVKSFSGEIDRIKSQISDLNKKIDKNLTEKIRELNEKKEQLTKEFKDIAESKKTAQDILSSLERQIAATDREIETLKQNTERIDKLTERKKEVENEIKDWSFLVKAFDKTGIPVLKLENSGIEITSIANELLSIFENKFRIVFETTRLKADKKSYKESFDINIVEEDGVTEISNKSGGQQVWLETAIQLAISLVVRNQGRNIETAFLDEKDGALDLDNAFSYIEMLRKAHELSGVYNTFIITHRPELLEFIPQQIRLTDGVLEVIKN